MHRILLTLAVLSIPGIAEAGEPAGFSIGHSDGEAIDPRIVATPSASSGWVIELVFDAPSGAADARSWELKVTGLEADGRRTETLGLGAAALYPSSLSDGSHVVASAQLTSAREARTIYAHFQRIGDRLVEEDLPAFLLAGSRRIGEALVFTGDAGTVAPAPGTEHLAPWDNPQVLPGDRAAAAAEATARLESGLMSSRAPETATGCEGAGGAFPLSVALLALLAAFMREHRRLALGIVFAVVATPMVGGRSHATVVYGYVAFWDSRVGSSAVGSRLDACVPSNTTCGATDPGCCVRGLPLVTVQIVNTTTQSVEGTVTSGLTGFYQFPDRSYSKYDYYQIVVTFDRAGFPGSMYLTGLNNSTPFTTTAGSTFTQIGGPYLSLGSQRVNAPSDSTSHEGNIATIWHAITYSFTAFDLEGETRHHRDYGSVNAYDPLEIQYRQPGDAGAVCKAPSTPVAMGRLTPSTSRLTSPHWVAGSILLGRVTACNDGLPFFPHVKTYDTTHAPTSEAIALARGIGWLAVLISRFNPQTAAIADVKSGTNTDCELEFVRLQDLYPNSNSAAWPINNAYGLWELIDADTLESDDGVSDTVDWSLGVIMEALYRNSIDPGSPPLFDHSYQEFSATAVSPVTYCNSNEDCANDHRCVSLNSTCHYGDVDGGNLGDLAYHLGIVQGLYALPGNIPNTLKSSKCLHGGPDHSHPFNGSYRDD